MHLRRHIRDAVKAAIDAGSASLTGRVSGVRQFPRSPDACPACEVSTPSEDVEWLAQGGAMRREVEITVTLFVAEPEPEDALDDLAEEVEAAIYADSALRALVGQMLTAGTVSDYGQGGEKRPARMDITFVAFAETDEADPQNP